MRVLITGGTGFIGRHLMDELVERGHDVSVLDDLSGSTGAEIPPRVDLLEHDVSDPGVSAVIAAAAPDVVVHAAAQVSVARSMASPDRDRAVNIEGTANVLRGVLESGARRVVFLSSGGAMYGESDGSDELARPAPKSYYAVHKYAAERYVELAGVPFAIARIANVFGPGQRSDLEGGVVSILLTRLLRGEPVTIFGGGHQRRDFVYVLDIVDALVAMIDSERTGTWNVGTGVATSILDLLHELETLTQPAVRVDFAAARPGDLNSSCLDVARIKTELGWAPTRSLSVALAQTVAAASSLGDA